MVLPLHDTGWLIPYVTIHFFTFHFFYRRLIMSIPAPLSTLFSSAVHEYAAVSPADIPLSVEVRRMCEANRCGLYGKNWCCPPGVGDWEALRDEYRAMSAAVVFTTKHDLEDSFDIEGMTAAKEAHRALDARVAERLHEAGIPHVLLGAGGCTLCKTCTYPDAPCRHPDRVIRPMEGCGIDVVSLSRIAGVKYNNGADTVTYFSLILFR